MARSALFFQSTHEPSNAYHPGVQGFWHCRMLVLSCQYLGAQKVGAGFFLCRYPPRSAHTPLDMFTVGLKSATS